MKTYRSRPDNMAAVERAMQNIRRQHGGEDWLAAHGLTSWCHFIANEISQMFREQREKGEFYERTSPCRECLVRVAAWALLAIESLDERAARKNDRELEGIDADQKTRQR